MKIRKKYAHFYDFYRQNLNNHGYKVISNTVF